MNARRVAQIVAIVVGVGLIAWGVGVGLDRLFNPPIDAPPEPAVETETGTAHITATLFYGSEDGRGLVAVRREVPLAEGIVAQGRAILRAQLQETASPYVSVIPDGTTLRAFYVTENGDAFVDLSSELSRAHPGGSLTEMLTVYAIVNAVTANLPAIQRVQLLIDGQEVDTVAGHVDIRRPLTRDTTLVVESAAP